jgi:hypothetical protein
MKTPNIKCPCCGKQGPCPVQMTAPKSALRKRTKAPDLVYFRRRRKCGACQRLFITVEIPIAAVKELEEMRAILARIHELTGRGKEVKK